MLFRRKTESVRAYQFLDSNWRDIEKLAGGRVGAVYDENQICVGLVIDAPHGKLTYSKGDWVIQYSDGTWDLLTDEEFKEKFEPMDRLHVEPPVRVGFVPPREPLSRQERLKADKAGTDLIVDVQYMIAVAMGERGWTQRDLAQRLGRSESTLSRQLGEDNNLTLRTVARVFYALGDAFKPSSWLWERAIANGRVRGDRPTEGENRHAN